jgi:hypothetical protein
MTKLDITKRVVSSVVGYGAGKIVTKSIHNNAHPESTLDRVSMGASTLVIGSMASEATKRYTDRKIDELVYWWKTNVN